MSKFALRLAWKVCEEWRTIVEQMIRLDSVILLLELSQSDDFELDCLSLNVFDLFHSTLFSPQICIERQCHNMIFQIDENLVNSTETSGVNERMCVIEEIFGECFRFFALWLPESTREIVRLYSLALKKRKRHSYGSVSSFVRSMIELEDDEVALLFEFDICACCYQWI